MRIGLPKSSRARERCSCALWHAASSSPISKFNDTRRKEKNKADTPPRGMPATSTREKRLTATSTSPEVLRKWRGRKSSPGSGPSTHLPSCSCQPVAYESALTARYSGGAAPAFNRFPWLPSAIDCWAKLSTSQRLRKREHHRPPDHQRNRDEIAWLGGVRRRRGRKVDYLD